MASFTNFATLSYNGGTTNSNTVTGELLEVLTVTKTAVVKNYAANDKITYIISIVNSGAQPVTNLTVTDNLGAYEFNSGTVYPLAYVSNSVRYYVNGVLQTAPTATPEPPLVITVPNVPANGSIMLVYEAEVTAYAPLSTDGSITNTANVTDGNLEVSASETVSTDDRAVLTISKALCPAVVTGNGQITYTFVIENTGKNESQFAHRWVFEWRMPDELLNEAYNRCVDNPGKVNMKYINAILESWHNAGIHTLKEAVDERIAAEARREGAHKPSYDLDEYEKYDIFATEK